MQEYLPAFTPQAGKQNGLHVVFDMKAKDVTLGSVQQEFLGIQASVTAKNGFPMMTSSSFLIEPGKLTEVEIVGTYLHYEREKCKIFSQLFVKNYAVKYGYSLQLLDNEL